MKLMIIEYIFNKNTNTFAIIQWCDFCKKAKFATKSCIKLINVLFLYSQLFKMIVY